MSKQRAIERTPFNHGRNKITQHQQQNIRPIRRRTFKGVPIVTLPDEIAPRRPSVGYDDGYELGTAVDGIW